MAALAVGCAGGPADMSASPAAAPIHPACAQADVSGGLCIVILGDSIGVGAPLTGDDRWWPQLRGLLEVALPGRTIAIDNWAVSGSQVDLLESSAAQPAIASYDLAIVLEGVNDVRVATPIDAWRSRYEAAVARIESQGTTVILATPPPEVSNGSFDTRFDPLAAAIRAVAATNRSLVDLSARWRADGATAATTYYVDEIHQGPAGQAVMAMLTRDVVLEALKRQPTPSSG